MAIIRKFFLVVKTGCYKHISNYSNNNLCQIHSHNFPNGKYTAIHSRTTIRSLDSNNNKRLFILFATKRELHDNTRINVLHSTVVRVYIFHTYVNDFTGDWEQMTGCYKTKELLYLDALCKSSSFYSSNLYILVQSITIYSYSIYLVLLVQHGIERFSTPCGRNSCINTALQCVVSYSTFPFTLSVLNT